MSFHCVYLPYHTDAACYYAALADLPWAVWLDSCGMSRFDILSASPQHTFRGDSPDPLVLLRKALGDPVAPVADIPFAGGALGYWGYDLACRMMGLPESGQSGLHDIAVGIYDWALILDHELQVARLVSHCRYAETKVLLPQILSRLQNLQSLPADNFQVHGQISSNFTPASYAQAFAAVQSYLQAGDCYQINLAQRFSAKAQGCAFNAYLTLRSLSPAPYSAYMNLPDSQILCASPERFLSVQNGKVNTRPIKGTRPRGANQYQDQLLAEELRHHPKDRAENLMIVDLLRNDLGKSCIPGSVRVPELFKVESYARVHHLVSTIEGRLAPGCDALALLCGCFPGGSVTGAPKRRAMEIIAQLEPENRGIYCGTIGYAGFDGNMDSNIVIRTLIYSQGEISCWAGGGIVADSELQAEYQESLHKAAAMLELLASYGGKRQHF